MAKPLTESDKSIIRKALDACDNGVRPAHRYLKDSGTYFSLGSVSKVKSEVRKTDGREAHLDPCHPIVRGELIRRLMSRPLTVRYLASLFQSTEGAVTDVINHLDGSGYNVHWDGDSVRILKGVGYQKPLFNVRFPMKPSGKLFGVLGDTHLCSSYERLDVLEAAYDRFEELGIKDVLHTGDVVDGHTHFNRFKLKAIGITDQALYVCDHYPQRSSITTHYITAGEAHEGWWSKREGIDFGRYLYLEAQNRGRKDLNYLGCQEADVSLVMGEKSGILRLVHPGGGTGYATSYLPQKIVESLQGGEKPGLLLVGHTHKSLYFLCRNVHVLLTGTTQDQSDWMRAHKLEAHVGFWTLGIKQDVNGAIREVTPTFTNFYDRGYSLKGTL